MQEKSIYQYPYEKYQRNAWQRRLKYLQIVGSMNIPNDLQGFLIHSVAVIQIMIDISEATVNVEDVIKK